MTGTSIEVLGDMDSIVPSKHSQGGQSSKRFERLRDIAINEFFVKLGDRVSNSILPFTGEMKGIIIGGCGMTKDEFAKGDFLHHEIRKKVIGTFDTCYTNEHGLNELADAAKEKLTGITRAQEKETFDTFLKQLAKDINKCAYGVKDVSENAQNGKAKKVMVSSDKHELIKEITMLSNQLKFEVNIITESSDSGKILNQAFGGIVAILRYT
jgi:peptide chain release factor subunit 1